MWAKASILRTSDHSLNAGPRRQDRGVQSQLVGHGDERGPFDARVWQALGTATRRSRRAGAPALSATPVLLALLEPRRGPARRLLRALDVDHAALRRRVGELARPARPTADPGPLTV
jgi:hypothetical protein